MVTMLNARIPLAMPAPVLTAFGRWTLVMCRSLGRDMVTCYLEWHSGCINPKELNLPPAIFDYLAQHEALTQKQNKHTNSPGLHGVHRRMQGCEDQARGRQV